MVKPGWTIEGIISDVDTDKPLADCSLRVAAKYGAGFATYTDSMGRYLLKGVTATPLLFIDPPNGSTYLGRFINISTTKEVRHIRKNFRLAEGVKVKGQVTDKQTGKGVMATIRSVPLKGNTSYNTKEGFREYPNFQNSSVTDGEGRFEFATIPGKSLMIARTFENVEFSSVPFNPYRQAIPDPNHPDLFHSTERGWKIETVDSDSVESNSSIQAVKVIDIKPTGTPTVELVVDRGRTGSVDILIAMASHGKMCLW